MPRLTQLPPHLPHAFTVAEAAAAGLSYSRLRSSDLLAPFHGVRARHPAAGPDAVGLDPAGPDAIEARVRAMARLYAPRLTADQFFCEATALALHGLPLPRSRNHEDAVHVGTPPHRRPPQTRRVIGHRSQPGTLAQVTGLPICSAVHAWVQCATSMNLDEIVVIGDALVCRRSPIATMSQLAQVVRSRSGLRGYRILSEAIVLVRSGTDSPRETLTRLALVRSGLPEPLVNATVRDRAGRWLGRSDLVYPEWMTVVEYEGGYHFQSDTQIRRDIDRIDRMVRAGWRVIRVHKQHLRDPGVVALQVREALETRGWRRPVPSP